MYFTDDSLLPENQAPLIITAAPYGPMWLPEDSPEDIEVSWEAQVQKAVDCYNAGTTRLHIHVRDPTEDGSKAQWQGYGTRRHIKGALALGTTMEETMAVLKLCVVAGAEACQMAVPILAEELERSQREK